MLDVDSRHDAAGTEAALSDAGIEKSDLDAAISPTSRKAYGSQHMIRGELRSAAWDRRHPGDQCRERLREWRSAFNSAVNFVSGVKATSLWRWGLRNVFARRELMFSVFDVDGMSPCGMRRWPGWPRWRRRQGADGQCRAAYSVFMDVYAPSPLSMKRFGTTRAQLAAVAAKNHNHPSIIRQSQYRTAIRGGSASRTSDRLS